MFYDVFEEYGTLTASSFADIYESVTAKYDLYREQFDVLDELQALAEASTSSRNPKRGCHKFWVSTMEYPFYSRLVVSVERYGWDQTRLVLGGKHSTVPYQRLESMSDWIDFYEHLSADPRYTTARKYFGLPDDDGRFRGRAPVQVMNRMGLPCLKLDGVTEYGGNIVAPNKEYNND